MNGNWVNDGVADGDRMFLLSAQIFRVSKARTTHCVDTRTVLAAGVQHCCTASPRC